MHDFQRRESVLARRPGAILRSLGAAAPRLKVCARVCALASSLSASLLSIWVLAVAWPVPARALVVMRSPRLARRIAQPSVLSSRPAQRHAPRVLVWGLGG